MSNAMMMQVSGRYTLHAYVCAQGCVKWRESMGSVSFDYIYVNRPNDCRYAVAGEYDVKAQGERVLVWDLYNVSKNARGQLVTPMPVRVHVDVNSAVMATSILYDKPPEGEK
jgi:allophanate hydrolase subunit 2